jgi:ABC-2 type transport system permease protein
LELTYLFGNVMNLAEIISLGQMDYYLSFPQPVLLHTLASRSISSGLGDFSCGVICFFLSGYLTPTGIGRFVLGVFLSAIVFLSFLVLVQSLAFWIGNAQMLSSQAVNAIVSFATYPITLFDGSAKLLLFTLIPAAFVGPSANCSFGFLGFLLCNCATGLFILLAGLLSSGLRR